MYGFLKNLFEESIPTSLFNLPLLFVYMDDIIVGSKSHYKHLRLLFERLKKFGLVININKCILGKPSVKFLGHYINHIGVSITCRTVLMPYLTILCHQTLLSLNDF